jgi:hypothetical protein
VFKQLKLVIEVGELNANTAVKNTAAYWSKRGFYNIDPTSNRYSLVKTFQIWDYERMKLKWSLLNSSKPFCTKEALKITKKQSRCGARLVTKKPYTTV